MVFDELRASPEVLYGAVIAFVIVVLLTPAVGGMARLLGAVDRPDARRINRRPIPRLGGLAIFLGILVPALAFLDLSGESRGVLLGAAIATVVGAVDDFRGLSPTVKLVGQVVAASIPCAFGVWIDHFTLPFVGVLDIPAWIGDAALGRLHRGRDEHGQLPRRARRARRGGVRHRRSHLRDPRALAREAGSGDPLGDRRGRLPRVSPSQLLPGADLHGRLGRAAASGSSWRRSRSRGC